MTHLYLDLNQIRNLASSSMVYERGHEYFDEDRVSAIEINEADEEVEVCATVFGRTFSEYSVKLTFSYGGILKSHKCDCDASMVWRGACKHIIATMFAVYRKNREILERDRIARNAEALLNDFEREAYEEIDGEIAVSNVSMPPCFYGVLGGGSGSPEISLAIGERRKYIVKNITSMLSRFKNQETYEYGKGFVFTHKRSSLSPKDALLLDLAERECEAVVKPVTRYGIGYYNNFSVSKTLPLSKRGVDEFFDIFAGETIDSAVSGEAGRTLYLTDSKPDVSFSIETTERGADITGVLKPTQLFLGERYGYVITAGKLHRTSSDYVRTLDSLTKAAHDGKISFRKKEFARLSAFFLPRLAKHGFIGETSLPTELSTFPLVKKVYADARDGAVFLKVTFCYGAEEFNALDIITPDVTRDVLEEYKIKSLITRFGFLPAEKEYALIGDDKIFNFYRGEGGLPLLREICEVYATDAFLNKSVRQAAAPSFGLRIDGGLLNVSIKGLDYPKEELLDILESFREKKKYHRLKDGTFVTFENDAADGFDAAVSLLSGLGVSDKDMKKGELNIPKYRALYAERVLSESKLKAERDESFTALTDDFKRPEREPSVPLSLDNTLRGYQKIGFSWLVSLARYGFGGILADDMGLGKTIQVITVILDEKQNGKSGKPSIVIAPKSLIYNWEREFNKFAPEINVLTIDGAANTRKEIIGQSAPDVYVTTYDTLKRDAEHYADTKFKFIIADEAQKIKNPSTQNAKAIKELDGESRFALTGTPIENSLSELWSIFDFIMPGYLFSSAQFVKKYETPIIKYNDEQKANELKTQLAPFILRRTKKEVLTELPDKIETTLFAEMTPEQRKLYAAYLLKAKGELKQLSGNEDRLKILQMLTRLRQICCHPATFIEDYSGGSGKLSLTEETLEEYIEAGHRVLVFSQFTKMLEIIRAWLDKNAVSYFYLDGGTPARDRLDMTESFNEGEGSVFLISLRAGGMGLNLTGADVVLHYDQWWNPAVMDQATDRAHRIGQKQTVQVVNIIAKDSIEEKITELQLKKKDLADTVIQGDAAFISKMTDEELRALFV
ncbi:helicase [Clostridia bacterium]|nr:helicase [Clostridia bacterium]